MAQHGIRRLAFLLITGLALGSGLVACGDFSDADPSPAPAEPPSTAVPVEPPAQVTPEPPTETSRPPPTTPEASIPEPVEPGTSAASPPADEATATTLEEALAPEPEPSPLLYDTYDRSGAVTDPGHYAFLADPADPGSAVTTYEGLRDGTATALLIHTHDTHGVSQADFYDAIETGDLVEWKQADDCFVRYTVTSAPAPAAGATAQSFGVAWMTYAFTGCSGAIAGASGSAGSSTTTTVDVTWGAALPDLGGTSLTAPIRHGPFQIVPEGWTGATEGRSVVNPPAYNRDNPRRVESLAEARQLPYWRDPALPAGWAFLWADMDPEETNYGYFAVYLSPTGGVGLRIEGEHLVGRGWPRHAAWRPNSGAWGGHGDARHRRPAGVGVLQSPRPSFSRNGADFRPGDGESLHPVSGDEELDGGECGRADRHYREPL